MKLVFNGEGSKPKGGTLLPLIPTEARTLNKENSIELLLATDPLHMDTTPKFKMNALILSGGEEVRSVLMWKRDVGKVFHGLNIITGPNQDKMVRNLLHGTANTCYEAEIYRLTFVRRKAVADAAELQNVGSGQAIEDEDLDLHTDVDDVENAIKHMMTQILPRRVLARVKRYLRRECRKPGDMKVKIYLQHLLRINYSEVADLPPFAVTQALTPDELIDIVLFGTPKSWQKEMDRQGFDPMEKTINEVVDFMERIESSEDFEYNKASNNDKPKSKSSHNHKGKSGYSKVTTTADGDKFCLYHGRGSHSSDECTVLKHMASQKKAKFEGNNSSNNYNSSSKGGNWKKKADEGGYKSKKDLAAFVKKAVKQGVQKELFDKKRKADKAGELDLNALENELKDFNYTSMDEDMLNTLNLSDEEASSSS